MEERGEYGTYGKGIAGKGANRMIGMYIKVGEVDKMCIYISRMR